MKNKIDLVFIDGRFRVACCLKCHAVINSGTLVAFDDFLNREQYGVVLFYYDIIDRTTDNRMAILRKKENGRRVPPWLIRTFELIAD